MENKLKVDYSWLENMDSRELHKTLQLLLDFRKNPTSLDNCIDKAVELLNDIDARDTKEPTNRINSTVNEDVEENKPVDDSWHNRGDLNFFEDGFLIRHLHDDVYDVITCNRMYDESKDSYVYFYRSGLVDSDIVDDEMISKIASFAGEDVSTYKDNVYLYIEDLVRYLGLRELDPYCKVFNNLTMDEVKTLLEEDGVKISIYDKEKEKLEVE